ncbi:MAG: transcription-repair coupling factor [Gammaproteobacteria bacterium]|nr:MAG: transcription-repair coupling factor [Gammaproteobacteria bacterium]
MTFPDPKSEKPVFVSSLSPVLPTESGEVLRWSRLYGSARGLALANAARRHPGPLLVVTASVHAAEQIEDEIRFYGATADTPPLLHFPDWECLPYDVVSPHQGIVSERLETLYRLPGLTRGIVLAAVPTLMHRLAPREYVGSHSFVLTRGERLDLASLRTTLAHAGYNAVSQVMEPGEFAVRGGVIDLFPAGSQTPYRLDLFGDEVESIREFDPSSQRSGKQLDGIRLLPAREFPLTEEAIQGFRQAFRARFEGDPQKAAVYRDVSKGLAPAGVEYYLPLFFGRLATIFDYLPDSTLCVLEAGVEHTAREFEHESRQRHQDLRHDRERPLLAPEELFLDTAEFTQRIARLSRVELLDFQADEAAHAGVVGYDTLPPMTLPVDYKSNRPYGALFDYLRSTPERVLLVAETPGRKETLRELLQAGGQPVSELAGWENFMHSDARVGLAVANIERGLRLPALGLSVITEPQLYGERAVQRRRREAARDPEAVIRSLAELRVGDPVVHEDHGVGRYLGLQTLDIGDGRTEFLTLEYADSDKLYIPVLSLHLITRYTGTDPEHAPLHKLGGEAWDKARRRALEKAWDAAAELLDIYAQRAARSGHAFPMHDTHYQAFADTFPFEETPDQARAINEVLADMEAGKPMDRLVCGDVGFGKTEVALRAAFLAVYGKKQVAVLVPTTLLAQQHYQNFRDRFAGLPVRIELMSRFRSKTEQHQAAQGLADGTVDIVIGTHRLLQEDIRFKQLGLVILDEEHRFGVRQKERLRKLRAEVDVLTMTATPIPRTLNMALASLRDISLITTAPEGRLSVRTAVSEWNKSLIREACLREIRRGGQVYYLHNEVRTIDKAARELAELLPEADIRVAHGQMPEHDLERIMLDFYHRRFNILVCSTIIESGIDVPTANTIIIERADKFGLAQLHQLRGRVGRSHHRAYAYLLIPGWKAITGDARKRLEAIQSLEELGAGFALASHDLEIRGAGELLGEQQSGAIDEVGFSLYSELLDRAVKSLKEGKKREDEAAAPRGTEVNLHAPVLLPEDYLPDVHMRLVLYKRIAGCADAQALLTLREEVIDRFGPLPEPAKLLFRATELKLAATALGMRKIDAGPRGVRIEFTAQPPIDPMIILKLVQSAPKVYRLEKGSRLRVLGEMPEVEVRLKTIQAVLTALTPKAEK